SHGVASATGEGPSAMGADDGAAPRATPSRRCEARRTTGSLGRAGAVLGVLGDREREPHVAQVHGCAGCRRRARISYAAPRRVVSAGLSAGREEVAQHPLDIVDYNGAIALPGV